jgi:SAM-dependent methyltransferase
LLAEQGYHVTWNDLREEVAEYVRLKRESGTIRFAPGNVFDLEFRDTFDLVLATEVIEHIAHPDEFLAQLARMLKPRGYIVLTTPNGAYFRNRLPKFSDCPDPAVFEADQFKPDGDGHIFVLHPEELKILAVKAGPRLYKDESTYRWPFCCKSAIRENCQQATQNRMRILIDVISHLLRKTFPRRVEREQGSNQHLSDISNGKARCQLARWRWWQPVLFQPITDHLEPLEKWLKVWRLWNTKSTLSLIRSGKSCP